MCRFALYLGPEIRVSSLVTEPSNSIIHQSYRSREAAEPLNGDGFGIAWYDPLGQGEPTLFKDISPAWNDFNLRQIAPVTRSHCILAHVRAATLGLSVTQFNCHPFAWERFAFMHNGTLGGFRRIKRRLQARLSDEAYDAVKGSTDSEHLMALFIDAFRARQDDGTYQLEKMKAALLEVIETSEELRKEAGVENERSTLNLALTDGNLAVVTRWVSSQGGEPNTLYVHEGTHYVCENGVCRMIDDQQGHGTVIITSEPLGEDCGWEKVPRNHIVTVDQDRRPQVLPI
ncbi:MAG TPA: class II glutamine amidotransferase [Acidobacteriota bacterium]|nr:class II glutamine amidotransferase [Acidobacteriota bacterium]